MEARYRTECATCDGNIEPGEEIARDAKGRWVHADLEQCEGDRTVYADDFIGKPVDICPVCHCMRPCWCPDAVQAPEDAAAAALRRARENAARDPWEGF